MPAKLWRQSGHHSGSLLLRLTAAIVMAGFGASYSHVALADQTTPPGATWHLSYGFVDKNVPLCRALAQEAKRQLETSGGLCGFPIAPDDRRFGVVPWKRLAPKEDLALLKSIFAWFLLGSNYLGPHSYSDLMRSNPDILSADAVDDLWQRYSHNIPELIASDQMQLETANLEVGPGGTPIQVYRVTVLEPDTWPEIGEWKVRMCNMPNNHTSRAATSLYFPLRPNRWQEFKVMNSRFFQDVLLWNHRAYVGSADRAAIGLHGLDTLSDGTLFFQQSACEINIRKE